MGRYIMDFDVQSQISLSAGVATTLAAALSFSTDADCLVSDLLLQAATANSGVIYVGKVNASGTATAASNAGVALIAAKAIALSADDKLGDEDRAVFDLRRISVLESTGTQLLNVAFVRVYDVKYTG